MSRAWIDLAAGNPVDSVVSDDLVAAGVADDPVNPVVSDVADDPGSMNGPTAAMRAAIRIVFRTACPRG
jgi:hypothetical protein